MIKTFSTHDSQLRHKRGNSRLNGGRPTPAGNCAHGQMYAYGQVRVAKGENRTAREVSEAWKKTIRAARARGSAV
jgi:hypothetical protein